LKETNLEKFTHPFLMFLQSIPNKALEPPLNTNPHSRPRTSQQSLVSKENSPLTRISKAIYQVNL
jgi:hypothetical protein